MCKIKNPYQVNVYFCFSMPWTSITSTPYWSYFLPLDGLLYCCRLLYRANTDDKIFPCFPTSW